jgi:hypothetical protein
VQGCLDVLDEANSISVEGFGEVDVFSILFVGDHPLSSVDDALSAGVGVSQFARVPHCLGLSLLVGDDELVFLHAATESFAEGKLGMGDDVWFSQQLEFVY